LLSCLGVSIPARERMVMRFLRDASTRGTGRARDWPAAGIDVS
jgi:hypothetical protein